MGALDRKLVGLPLLPTDGVAAMSFGPLGSWDFLEKILIFPMVSTWYIKGVCVIVRTTEEGC